MKKKITLTIICAVLSCVCLIGTTFAWLVDKTDPVKNTFTVGDINIDLTESDDLDLKMVPGTTITKDPIVTVEAGSEACWLFVKVEKSANFDTYMTYSPAAGWDVFETDTNYVIYSRKVSYDKDNNQDFAVLLNNKVNVKESVTKAQLETAKINAPTLTFTAYAVQQEGVATAADAWAKVTP